MSDASRARLNALKTKYVSGEKLTNKEKLEFRDLIESDQRSDVLLDKFRKDPNSLNSKERDIFKLCRSLLYRNCYGEYRIWL